MIIIRDPRVRASKERQMEQDNSEVVRSFFAAFNDGDLDRAAANVSDDFELLDVAAGQIFRGPEGCRQWLETFRAALPDAQTELVNVFAEGSRVATEHIGRGTHSGPFVTAAGTIPATGRKVELRIAELYELREGKIVRLHAFYDSATMMRQLGLLPPPGSALEHAMTAAMGLAVRAKRGFKRS
jgi:steroid delta-isomerase-like uncharacterized protein